jgi:hypothetical protein
MNSFAELIRAMLWLSKRDWGRSIFLGLGSLGALAAIPQNAITEGILDCPVFRAGFYAGTVLMPKETIGGHSLFGLVVVILMLVGFWFVVLCLARRLFVDRTARQLGK